MNIEQDTVIVLENDKEYVITSDIEYQGKRYFLATGLDENENLVIKDIAFLQEIKKDDKTLVLPVTDQELLKTLIPIFEKKINNSF